MKCNLCDYEGEFLPMGNRKNARCPNCKSLERHRDIVKHLELDGYVLEVYTNHGLSNYLKKNAHNYTLESVNDLNSAKGKYNHVIALHVLQNIANSFDALENIFNLLPENGILWLQVPFEKQLTHNHKSLFTKRGLKANLKKIGFSYEVVDSDHYFIKCTKNERLEG